MYRVIGTDQAGTTRDRDELGFVARVINDMVDRVRHSTETLAHDVFLAYFLKAGEVLDSTSWLLAAMCNASRSYLRSQARHVDLPRDVVGQARAFDNITDHLVAREVLCCLTPRCQLALGLRYLEGYTIPEVAAELRTSPKYAGKLVARCLEQAQERYSRKERE